MYLTCAFIFLFALFLQKKEDQTLSRNKKVRRLLPPTAKKKYSSLCMAVSLGAGEGICGAMGREGREGNESKNGKE